MNLKLTLGMYSAINEVGDDFFNLITFSENIFWSVNFALSFC